MGKDLEKRKRLIVHNYVATSYDSRAREKLAKRQNAVPISIFVYLVNVL